MTYRSQRRSLREAACTALALAGLAASVGTAGAQAADNCPNAALRAASPVDLPDCRGYERVTPDKRDDIVPPGTLPSGQASEDGSKLLFTSQITLAGATTGTGNDYVSSRGTDGWGTIPVTPAVDPGSIPGNAVYNSGPVAADLSTVSVSRIPFAFSNFFPDGGDSAVQVGPPHGPLTTLAGAPFLLNWTGLPLGGSRDLSTLAFQSNLPDAVVPGAPGTAPGVQVLYESVGGQNRLVGVDDGGALLGTCGSVLGNGIASSRFGEINTVSQSGSTIFFESPDPQAQFADPSCSANTRLYARLGGAHTVEVSAPEAGVTDPNGPAPVIFAGAAADGSKVFFVTTEELTADDTTHDPELYEYDFAGGGSLTRVSRGESGTADGDVDWAIASDDGSQLYFVAHGQLVAGRGVAGAENLYRYDTAQHTYTYIGALNGHDTLVANHGGFDYNGPHSDSQWLTSADGRYLLFASQQDLAGADPSVDLGHQELFRYDARGSGLVCVSCLPAGAAPTGDAQFAHTGLLSRYARAMSQDGDYVFFDTPDQLLPQDANKVRDVYEWHAGQLSLLTSGTDSYDSWFVDASVDGHDAFVATHSQLVPADADAFADLYDARIDGGVGGQAPPSPPAPCVTDACQGPPTAPPTAPTIATVTFQGAGNLPEAPEPAPVSTAVGVAKVKPVTGTTATVKVKVPGAGAIALSGGAVHRATRAATRAATYSLKVSLTAKAKASLKKKGTLKAAVTIGFTPSDGERVSKKLTLTFKQPAAKRRAAAKGDR